MVKTTRKPGKSPDEVDLAVQQIVASAIISDEVIDVFSAAGLPRPDITILSDEFRAEVQAIPYKNVAAELLRKLLEEELRGHARTNIIQSRKFSPRRSVTTVRAGRSWGSGRPRSPSTTRWPPTRAPAS